MLVDKWLIQDEQAAILIIDFHFLSLTWWFQFAFVNIYIVVQLHTTLTVGGKKLN